MARRKREAETEPSEVARLERVARQVASRLRLAGLSLDETGQVGCDPRVEAALAQAKGIADPGARLDFLLAFSDELAADLGEGAQRVPLPDSHWWRSTLGRPAP